MRLTRKARDRANNELAGSRRLTTLTWKRHRCPECNGTQLTKYRSVADQGDGTALAWVRCATCGERFRVVYE